MELCLRPSSRAGGSGRAEGTLRQLQLLTFRKDTPPPPRHGGSCGGCFFTPSYKPSLVASRQSRWRFTDTGRVEEARGGMRRCCRARRAEPPAWLLLFNICGLSANGAGFSYALFVLEIKSGEPLVSKSMPGREGRGGRGAEPRGGTHLFNPPKAAGCLENAGLEGKRRRGRKGGDARVLAQPEVLHLPVKLLRAGIFPCSLYIFFLQDEVSPWGPVRDAEAGTVRPASADAARWDLERGRCA